MRKIGIVTTSRADYGIYRPLLARLEKDAPGSFGLFVSGTHLSPAHGLTVREIDRDGHRILARVNGLVSGDTPLSASLSSGLSVLGFAEAFERERPDILVLLGDRFEMHAAAVAAVPLNIPLAHLHGGELTLGAIDDAYRHSLTKLSHLHFASAQPYARRILQLGEEPWRVTVSGALSLDAAKAEKPMTDGELLAQFGLSLPERFILVTYHPATLSPQATEKDYGNLLAALHKLGLPAVFTMPNADNGSAQLRRMTLHYASTHSGSHAVESLGSRGYFTLMGRASAMAGNSSSGITEAGFFGLPVVNVGNRQEGRLKGKNVIDAPPARKAIEKALQNALSPGFRESFRGEPHPYGDGRAAEKIARVLLKAPLGPKLLTKKFADWPLAGEK